MSSNHLRDKSGEATWIVSPLFDLCFFVNLWWVGIALLGWLVPSSDFTISFWQVYFITTPHRWLTLFLVAADPDRRGGRDYRFIGLAIAFAAFVFGVHWYSVSTGKVGGSAVTPFLCLALIDYLWNTWHFAAQHGGILRAYSRKAGGGLPRLETFSVRLLVCFVGLRLAGWTTGWLEPFPTASALLRLVDFAVVVPAAIALAYDLSRGAFRARLGKILYFASVISLYSGYLFASHFNLPKLVAALAISSAAFHAVEYIAFVSYYARRREGQGTEGLFRTMARHWTLLLGAYLVFFGGISEFATRRFPTLWTGLNLWAAYLHYAFDGMIWKFRRPETAKTLGVENTQASS